MATYSIAGWLLKTEEIYFYLASVLPLTAKLEMMISDEDNVFFVDTKETLPKGLYIY